MTIQGISPAPVGIQTSEFKEFEGHFNNKLVCMHEINYADVVPDSLGDASEWNETIYYHGTTHCGCLGARIDNPDNKWIQTDS
ncbi:hypothetical protein BGX29_008708, partial [Mortierella sp. GBA35]